MDTFVELFLMLMMLLTAIAAVGTDDTEKGWDMAVMTVAFTVALTVLQIA